MTHMRRTRRKRAHTECNSAHAMEVRSGGSKCTCSYACKHMHVHTHMRPGQICTVAHMEAVFCECALAALCIIGIASPCRYFRFFMMRHVESFLLACFVRNGCICMCKGNVLSLLQLQRCYTWMKVSGAHVGASFVFLAVGIDWLLWRLQWRPAGM